MKRTNSPPASQSHEASPVGDLEEILGEAGEDISVLFSAALGLYAGPFAITKTEDEKYADLERLIMNGPK